MYHGKGRWQLPDGVVFEGTFEKNCLVNGSLILLCRVLLFFVTFLFQARFHIWMGAFMRVSCEIIFQVGKADLSVHLDSGTMVSGKMAKNTDMEHSRIPTARFLLGLSFGSKV